ncbi:MAG TPA: mechanosensitive ion channel domain-containing protein [Gaiellaceae bacterium]|nr:mechanosensitive ion channel domain-containing protein [Gaiellaceae bacterium]
MPLWERGAIAAGVVVAAIVVAQLVDRVLMRRNLPPEVITRYRVFRRAIEAAIVVVGILSALLVIPAVRALAGGLLASSAMVAIIVGFAAQRTLGNFVAGILIALSQPVRIGDDVEVGGVRGRVEEIGLTYTYIHTEDDVRLVIPNEKLASDTIRNSTIRSRGRLAVVTVQVPLSTDLRALVSVLEVEAGDRSEVLVSDIADSATLVVRAPAPDEAAAERLESGLRLRIHEKLRLEGIYA